MEKMNIEKLRNDLKDYFGTAMMGQTPMAVIELSSVEKANDSELIKTASKNGFNLDKYVDYSEKSFGDVYEKNSYKKSR